jgi:hypothetical protein
MKLAVEMDSRIVIYIQSFVRIGSSTDNLMGGGRFTFPPFAKCIITDCK